MSSQVGELACERVVGRYALYGEIASGGMATVHFGRLLGPVGFARTVAIKRLHPQYAKDPEFVSMFLDEARLAARIQHPNVVATLDVVALEGELFLVMEYVQGESLARLLRSLRQNSMRLPLRIVASIITGVLHGLHAAHEASNERGMHLEIVHRDVSPQNVLIGSDGVARVLDFGVAKASGRVQTTREGQIKGKLAYMAPEQLRGVPVDRRVDVYGAAVVLWETLTSTRLFDGEHEGVVFGKVMDMVVPPPSQICPELPGALDYVVLRGLARDPAERFATTREMAVAIEDIVGIASPRQVGEYVAQVAGDSLARRAERVKEIESISTATRVAAAQQFAGGLGTPLPRMMAVPSSAEHLASAPPPGTSSGVGTLSRVSSISLSRPPGYARTKRRGPVAIIGAAVAVAAIGGAALALRSKPPEGVAAQGETPTKDSAQSAVSIAPTASAAPEATASAEPTAVAAVTSAAPSATPSVKPPGKPGGGHIARPPTAPPKTAAPTATPASPPAAPKVDNCNPPYTIDSSGIRRIKPECM